MRGRRKSEKNLPIRDFAVEPLLFFVLEGFTTIAPESYGGIGFDSEAPPQRESATLNLYAQMFFNSVSGSVSIRSNLFQKDYYLNDSNAQKEPAGRVYPAGSNALALISFKRDRSEKKAGC